MALLKSLLLLIHRRFLWQISLIYLAGAAVAYSVAVALMLRRELPDWFEFFAMVLLVIGWVIMLITACVQGGLPSLRPGLRAEGNADEADLESEAQGMRAVFTWRNAILGGVAAFTLWAMVAAGWLLLAEQLVKTVAPNSTDESTVEQQQR